VKIGFLVRVFLLASVAVVASVAALIRFYTHPRPPMMVPAPPDVAASAGERDWASDGGLVPAPEIEVVPR
jgi:hypothetical protein